MQGQNGYWLLLIDVGVTFLALQGKDFVSGIVLLKSTFKDFNKNIHCPCSVTLVMFWITHCVRRVHSILLLFGERVRTYFVVVAAAASGVDKCYYALST